MACHILPLEKPKKHGEMPLILRLVDGMSPCFQEVEYDTLSLNPSEKIFCLWFVHERRILLVMVTSP